MKKNIKKYISALLFAVALMLPSCGDDYLDVVDPNVLDLTVYPAEMADFELLMNDLYGRLRVGFYNSENGYKVTLLLAHDIDCGYTGSNFWEYSLNQMSTELATVRDYYRNMYQHVAKINDFLVNLREFEPLTPAAVARVKTMESEARFLRAYVNFHLLNLFGEAPIRSAADMNKLGIVMWVDEKPTSIAEAVKARSTQSEVWNQIISDLNAAIPNLEGIGKIKGEDPRIDEWAAKTLLAKAYMFTLEFGKAVPVLEDIINNSGKKLVSFDIYSNMFNSYNKFNSESIFEVNAARDKQTNNQMQGPVLTWMRFVGPTFINSAGKSDINGNANFFIHDENITRFGFDDSPWGKTTAAIYPLTNASDLRTGTVNAAYQAYSFDVRSDKSKKVDPRLFVNALQPFIDTLKLEGVAGSRPSGYVTVYKSRQEGKNNEGVIRAWPSRKGNNLETKWLNNNSINHYVFRLADVYLLYAEALIETGGSQAVALEYINKIRRRAYDQPVDIQAATYVYGDSASTPITGVGDYISLTDRTNSLKADDHLATNPLLYERWAELNQESWWWFDVRRLDLGQKEVDYYKYVNYDVLPTTFHGYYSLPIPQEEMDANSAVVQNNPYK